MQMEWPTLIEGGIPILGGLYATALGYGVIGAPEYPPSPLKQRFLARFRWLGPAVILFGVFTLGKPTFISSIRRQKKLFARSTPA